MKALIIKPSELDSLKSGILDRSRLLPIVDKAAQGIGPYARDAIVTAIERHVGYEVANWIARVSE